MIIINCCLCKKVFRLDGFFVGVALAPLGRVRHVRLPQLGVERRQVGKRTGEKENIFVSSSIWD